MGCVTDLTPGPRTALLEGLRLSGVTITPMAVPHASSRPLFLGPECFGDDVSLARLGSSVLSLRPTREGQEQSACVTVALPGERVSWGEHLPLTSQPLQRGGGHTPPHRPSPPGASTAWSPRLCQCPLGPSLLRPALCPLQEQPTPGLQWPQMQGGCLLVGGHGPP